MFRNSISSTTGFPKQRPCDVDQTILNNRSVHRCTEKGRTYLPHPPLTEKKSPFSIPLSPKMSAPSRPSREYWSMCTYARFWLPCLSPAAYRSLDQINGVLGPLVLLVVAQLDRREAVEAGRKKEKRNIRQQSSKEVGIFPEIRRNNKI